ncbi:MAG: SRPBCC family protein [Chthonomonas sp.]|nr:SRPBCC family protein [Chthonomonas sp.]
MADLVEANVGKTHVLECETFLPLPLETVFEFFSNAENLETITPKDLQFSILTPCPIEMRQGALIDYRLKLNGIPMTWKTEIEVWEPGVRFVDNQLKGPYKRWWHEHKFREVEGGVIMNDRVEYELPFGPLGEIAHALFVRKKVQGIFGHREAAIRQALGL